MGQKLLPMCFILAFVLITILSLNITSAEIMLSQPNSVYNLGDILEVQTTIKPTQDSSDFFELDLVCNESRNFYREYLDLEADEEKIVGASLILTRKFLENFTGNCYVKARFSYAGLNVENFSIEPGKKMELKGEAIKENGKKVEGFLELSIEDTEIKILNNVKNGSFVSNLEVPENMTSGYYTLKVRVYEKLGGEITNEGLLKTSLYVKQVPKKIDISLENASVIPGEDMGFKVTIKDQAGDDVAGNIGVKVYNVDNEVVFQKILESGKEETLSFENNATPGYWRVEANAFGLFNQKLFYVEELAKARFEIENETLIITNIGNTIYRRPIEVSINDFKEIKNVDIGLGESMKLKLSAPEGEYEVKVSDGISEFVASGVPLTGSIVGVSELKREFNLVSRYPIIWLFLMLVFGLFIFFMGRKVFRKKAYAYPIATPTVKAETERKEKKEGVRQEKEELKVPLPTKIGEAEHSLVLHGRKEKTGIVAVRIKNLNVMKKRSQETIDNVVRTIVKNNGVVYETSDYIFGIFSSLTTKTFNNEMLIVKTSKQINDILNEHNKKFKEKIFYGISINFGDLILKKEANKLKFTSVGNTINLAKRIASLSNEEILMSEPLQNRIMSEVKVEKEVRDGINVYHIKNIIERDKYKEFISDFLKRLSEEGKGLEGKR